MNNSTSYEVTVVVSLSEEDCPTMIESWMAKEADKLATRLNWEQNAIQNMPPWYPPSNFPPPWGPYPWSPHVYTTAAIPYDVTGCCSVSGGVFSPVYNMSPAPSGDSGTYVKVPHKEGTYIIPSKWDAIKRDFKDYLTQAKEWLRNEWRAFKS